MVIELGHQIGDYDQPASEVYVIFLLIHVYGFLDGLLCVLTQLMHSPRLLGREPLSYTYRHTSLHVKTCYDTFARDFFTSSQQKILCMCLDVVL